MIDKESWGHSYLLSMVKFLDLLRTHYCESICRIYFQRLRAKGKASKAIRYHPSLNHKPFQLESGGRYLYDPFNIFWEIKVFGFRGEYGRKAETERNWRKGTARSEACSLIWFNTGKLTRSRRSKDWHIDSSFFDYMGGGAWPFLVGGVICLGNSVNERDFNLLNSYT